MTIDQQLVQQLIPTKKLVELAQQAGVDFGIGDPNNRLRYYTKTGLIPRAVRKQTGKNAFTEGHYPLYVVGLLQKIQTLRKSGLPISKIKEQLDKERTGYSGVSTERKSPPQVTTAPGSLVLVALLLIIISATTLFFSPLNPKAYGELKNWVEKQIAAVIQPKSEELPRGEFASAQVISENLLINPSFENPVPTRPPAKSENIADVSAPRERAWRWRYTKMGHQGNLHLHPEPVRTGTQALRIWDPEVNPREKMNLGISQSETTTIDGRTYTLSVYLRQSGITGSPKIRLGFVHPLDQPQVEFPLENAQSWTLYSFTYESADPDRYPFIEIVDYQGGRIYLDDASLVEVIPSPLASAQHLPASNMTIGEGSIKVGSDGQLYPQDNSMGSLGTSDQRFGNLHTVGADITGTLTVGGATIISGDLTLEGEKIQLTNRFNSNLLPYTDNQQNLGSLDYEWQDLYLDGTAHIDRLEVDESADIADDLLVRDDLTARGDVRLGGGITNQIEIQGTTFLGDGGIANYVQVSPTGNLAFLGTADTITGPGSIFTITNSGEINITATGLDIDSPTINFSTQAVAVNLADSQTQALNIESGLLNLDTQNSRIGINNTAPALSLEIGDITAGIDAANGVGIAGDLEVEDFALLGALRVGSTGTDPGAGNAYIEGDAYIGGDLTAASVIISFAAVTDFDLATTNTSAADIDIGTSSQANTISIGTSTASSTLELDSADWGITTTGIIDGISGYTQDEGSLSHIGSTSTLDLTGAISWDTDSSMTIGAQSYALTADRGTITIRGDGTNDINLVNVGANLDIDVSTIDLSTQATDLNIIGNTASALTISESDNNYLLVTTTNDSETIQFGNAVTNPSYSFLGSSAVTVTGLAEGTTALGISAGDVVLTDGDLTLSGGEVSISGASGSALDIAQAGTGTGATLTFTNTGTVADALLIQISSAGTITDAIDVSDETIINALNVGANVIVGTSAAIDFSEFDVSATTGSITINDGGNAGQISIQGTVLDINSLDFTDAGTITSGGTNTNLTLNPTGSGDVYFHGATYNISDSGDITLGGRITFENNAYIQNEADGILYFNEPTLQFTASTALDIDSPTINLSTQATDFELKDDTASALTISEGSNVYFDISTTNATTSLSLDLPVGGSSSTIANLFTSNIAKVINLGTGTAVDEINIGTDGTSADDINIGNSSAQVAITGDDWSISDAGAFTTASTISSTYLPTSTTDKAIWAKPAATSPSQRWLFDGGSSYTDTATMMGDTDDYKYYGYSNQSTGIHLAFATPGVGYNISAEYSQGSSVWAALTLTDDTSDLTANENIYFAPPAAWSTDTVNSAGPYYWIRLKTSTNPTTQAIANKEYILPAGYALATYLSSEDTAPKFYVDYRGNVQVTTLLIAQDLEVSGNVQSDLVPKTSTTYDLGSSSLYWQKGYIDELTTNNIIATATEIGGTKAADFTVNSDNATADTEDMSLIFERGTSTPNAVFAWDSTSDDFTLNSSLILSSTIETARLEVPGNVDSTGGAIQTNSTDRIDNAGNLSNIGTYTASKTPAGSTAVDMISVTLTNNTDSGTQRGMVLDLAGSGVTEVGALIQYTGGGTGATGLEISGTWTNGLLIGASAGSVGIGTTNPGAKLEVNGDILANSLGSASNELDSVYLGDSDYLYFGDDQDVYLGWDGTDLDILALADASIIKFGTGTKSFDVWWYGSVATNRVIFDEGGDTVTFDNIDLRLGDNDFIQLGDAQDVTLDWDGTNFDILAAANASIMKFGDGTESWDIWWYGSIATNTVIFDEGGDTVTFDNIDLYLGDNDLIDFGDGQDVQMRWDGTNFDVLAAADDSGWVWGTDNDKAFLMTWHGNGAGDDVIFTPSANTWAFDGVDVHFEDNDFVKFGDAQDVTMDWDGTNFDILAGTDASVMRFGTGTNSFDVWWYGSLATNTVVFDEGADTVTFDNIDLRLGDNDMIELGDAQDLTIVHGGTNSTITSTTGNLVIDNTNVTGETEIQLGTDTNATAFQVLNNSGLELFEVDGAGNVGIGTTAPGYKLEVTGTGYFADSLTIAGTSFLADSATTVSFDAVTDFDLSTSNASAADIDIGTSSQANTISIGTSTASSTVEIDSADWGITTTGVIDGISGYTQSDGSFSHTGSTSTLDLTGAISWDTDSSMTIGAQSYGLTVDGGTLTLTGDGTNDINLVNTGANLDIDVSTIDLSTQATAIDLASSTTALNIESGLLNLDTSNSRVGIGTTAPGGTLDLGQTVTAASAGTYYTAKFNNSYTGTMTSATPVTSIYGLYNRPNVGIGGTSPQLSNLFVNYTSGNIGIGTTTVVTNLYLNYVAAPTTNGGSSVTNTYAFVSEAGAGNVGIGTTAPGASLHVGDGSSLPNFASGSEDVFIEGQLEVDGTTYFHGYNNFNATIDMNNELITNIGSADTDFTSGGGLNIAGNVGIGTTSPSEVLDVVGNITASGTITGGGAFTPGGNIVMGEDAWIGLSSSTERLVFDGTGGDVLAVMGAGLRIYDSSDTDYLNIAHDGTDVNITTNGTTDINLADSTTIGDGGTTDYAYFSTSGDLTFYGAATNLTWNTDGGGDIGASGASRPDHIYAKTDVVIGDTTTITTNSIGFSAAATFDLYDSSTTALNIESGLLNLDTSNSRVGIGTTAPGGTLDLGQTVTAASAGTYYTAKLNNSYTGTMASATPVTSIYGLYNRPNVGIGGTSPHLANLFVNYTSGNIGIGTTTVVTNLYLNYVAAPTTNGGSSVTNTYAFVSEAGAGNVGIGTTSPTADLHIEASDSSEDAPPGLYLNYEGWTNTGTESQGLYVRGSESHNAGNDESALVRIYETEGNTRPALSVQKDYSAGQNSRYLAHFIQNHMGPTLKLSLGSSGNPVGLQIANSGTGNSIEVDTSEFVVTSTGNVGIGTTDPGAELEVIGNILADSLGSATAELDSVYLGDSDYLYFGDAQDAYLGWDGTDLDILALADASVIKFGTGTNSFDVWWYGSAATNQMIFDEGADKLSFDNIDIYLGDNDFVKFGDAQDVTMDWDGTNFDILAKANAQIMRFGDGTESWDIWWYGSIATNTVIFDEGGDTMTFDNVDLRLGDNDLIELGDAQDLTIVHGGTNSTITSITGNLVLDNTNVTGETEIQLGTDTTATAFQVLNNSGLELFEVDGSGNVGIGTTGPSQLLHLYKSGADAAMMFETTGASSTSDQNSPSTIVDDDAIGITAWTNPSDAGASDNVDAYNNASVGSSSHYLKATNFGFSIPTGATIDGIVVEVEKMGLASGPDPDYPIDNAVRIVKGGSIGSTDKSLGTDWPSTDTYVGHGSSADLWGESWSAADINGTTFGVAISSKNAGTGFAYVDHIRITVYYTGSNVQWATGSDYSDSGKFKISYSSAVGTNDRLVIDSTGNVGIGTTDPGAKLEVVGNILADNLGSAAAELDNVYLGDSDYLYFGDDQDTYLGWDGTDFDILALADASVIKFGDGTESWDIWWYGSLATNTVIFDEGADTVTFDNIDLRLGDNDFIQLGDAQDVSLDWDGTNFDVLAGTNAQVMRFGDGTESWDIWWYGSIATNTVVFDEGADKVSFDNIDLYLGDNDILVFGDGSDLQITYDEAGEDRLEFSDGTNVFFTVKDAGTLGEFYFNGNVGIGTTSPAEQLDITGNFQIATTTSTAGQILQNGSRFIHTYGTNNIFIGKDAGNFTLTGDENLTLGASAGAALTSGYQNVMIGYLAGEDSTEARDTVFVGFEAGLNNTTGFGNTFVGSGAGATNTDGIYNMYLGFDAGGSATGGENVFVGVSAGAVTTGSFNTFVGSRSGLVNTSGQYNLFFGYSAGNDNEDGGNNVYIGFDTGGGSVSGSDNVVVGAEATKYSGGTRNSVVGYQAGYGTSGQDYNDNTIFGWTAGHSLRTGGSNVLIGRSAADSLLTGESNVIIGALAGEASTAGHNNAVVGTRAMRYSTGAENAILGTYAGLGTGDSTFRKSALLGYKAGYALTTGHNNILVGWQAGNVLTTGADNIIIGYDVDPSAADASNELNIGNLIYGDLSNGYVGIGTSNPGTELEVIGNILANNLGSATAELDNVYLGDSDYLYFGDDQDVYLGWDGTDFDILALANASVIKFGDGTESFDIWWYGSLATNTVVFDEGSDTVTFDNIDLRLGDNDLIEFGDAQDITMDWDGTNFDILAAADDQVLRIGNGTNSLDVWIYGNTASDNIIFDASGNELALDGVDLSLEDSDLLKFGDGDDLTIVHGGTNSTITSSTGNLVIDNTNATGETEIQLGTDTNATAFQVLNNTGLELFEVDGAGNVGIGTTGPSYKLEVNGDLRTKQEAMIGPDIAGGATVTNPYTDGNGGLWVTRALADGVSGPVFTVSSNNQGVGSGAGFELANMYAKAIIRMENTGSYESSLIFQPSYNSGGVAAYRDAMVINTAGNVGIGTTNPGAKLEVNGDILANSLGSASNELDSVYLGDSDYLYFGDGQDVYLGWDGTDFDILAAADASVIKFGTGTNSFDVWWYGSLATNTVIFDEGGDTVTFDNVDLRLGDNDFIQLGDAQDVTMDWDGTNFDILAAANAQIMRFGDGTESFDIWWYGSIATNTVVFDEGADKVSFDNIDLYLGDNDILVFGDGSDLQITYDEAGEDRLEFSDGTNVFFTVKDAGTLGEFYFNGNVGIGTTDPDEKLHVAGGNVAVGTDDTTLGVIKLYGNDTGSTEGGEMEFFTAADYDTTYDFYYIDAYEDDLRISRSGSADLKIKNTGKVLVAYDFEVKGNTEIGDASGDTVTFDADVWTNSSATTWNLANSSTTSLNIESGLLNIDTSNSRIGIGTTAPSYILHVGTSSDVGLGVVDSTGEIIVNQDALYFDAQLEMTVDSSNDKALSMRTMSDTTSPDLLFLRARDGDPTYTVQSGDRISSFIFKGFDSNTYEIAAQIDVIIDGSAGDGDMPGSLTFYTTPDGSTTTAPRLHIDNAGNVGIGTTNPGAKLHIEDADLKIAGFDGTQERILLAGDSNTPHIELFDTGVTEIKLATSGVSYLNGGNVGIGTTDPGYALDIVGEVYSQTGSGTAKVYFGHTGTFIERTGSALIIQADNRDLLLRTIDATEDIIFTANSIEAMRIDAANQNVGIGTTNPGATLEVNGDAIFGGTYIQLPSKIALADGSNTIINTLPYQPSLVANASFELDTDGDGTPDGWASSGNTDGSKTVTTDEYDHGSQSSHHTCNDDTCNISWRSNCFPITPGTSYTGAARAKGDAAEKGFLFRFYWYTNNDCSTASPTDVSDEVTGTFKNAVTTSWATYSGSQTSEVDAYYARVAVGLYNPDPNLLNLYIDRVTVQPPANAMDLAEMMASPDELEAGDIVSGDSSRIIGKSRAPDKAVLGIISTAPGLILQDGNEPSDFSQYPVALSGRVPVKVSTINGPIKPGDPITSSPIPGVGMKATQAGSIVAKALESFDNPDPNTVGKILAFVNTSWYDPDVYLTDTGELQIAGVETAGKTAYELKDGDDNLITRIGAFAQAAIANIKAGLIETTDLIAQRIEIQEKIISPLVETDEIRTDIISPLSNLDSSVTIDADVKITGNVGIGTTNPGAQLDLSTDSARKLTTTTWTTGSDARIKTNVQGINDALDIISQVRPVKYRFTQDFLSANPSVDDTDYYHFIAQEYQEVFPNSVTETDGLLYLNSSNMIPYAIAGIKELDQDVKEQQEILEKLNLRIDEFGSLGDSSIVEDSEGTEEKKIDPLADLTQRVESLEETVFSSTGEATPSAQLSSEISLSELFSLVSENEVEGDIKLDQNFILYNDLNVLGKTIVNDLGVTGQVTIGLLTIDGLSEKGADDEEIGATISTLSGPLKLQETALGNLEIMGGKIVIDTEGNLEIEGTITAQMVETGKIRITTTETSIEEPPVVENSEPDGAVIEEPEEEVLSTSVGTVTIPAGETIITVRTSSLTDESLIFVTPKRPVAIGSQKIGGEELEITIGEALEEDLEINWWVIN